MGQVEVIFSEKLSIVSRNLKILVIVTKKIYWKNYYNH